VRGQNFGGFSSDIEWFQINTKSARVIYAKGMHSKAQRIANAVEFLSKNKVEDIGDRVRKIDIILNNQSVVSNGSVGIAPWKSHFLTTPLQDNFGLTSLPWLDLLSVHEYRHVVQLSTAKRGITNVLYHIFGEESWAGAANISVPGWFTEGDAVWAETEMTRQGRGRIKRFMQGYRALAFKDLTFNYDKARNGSLKDYVPDHYRLGSMMLEYGHAEFGPNLWKEVLIEGSSFKGIFYPFSRALKKRTGLSTKALYRASIGDFYDQETSEGGQLAGNSVLEHTEDLRVFTDEKYPQISGDSAIVFYRSSYDRIGHFYIQSLISGEERELAVKGVGLNDYYGFGGSLLAWEEYKPDPRWSERSYSDIVTYDLASRKRKKLTRNQKYFSPEPNDDGTQIACVEYDEMLESSICILDAVSGAVIKKLSHPGWIYTYPRWSTDGMAVFSSVRDSIGDMAIVKINLQTGTEQTLIPFRNRLLGIPAVNDSEVFYTASTSGTEQIFATSISERETRQVTLEPNGAFQPAVHEGQLYYVTFTEMGHRIKDVPIVNEIPTIGTPFEFEIGQNVFDSLPGIRFQEKKYLEPLHAINVHTWGLTVVDGEASARVLSKNILNNIEISAGVSYDLDDRLYRPFAKFEMAVWYPILTVQGSSVRRSATVRDQKVDWRETSSSGGFYVPLNFPSASYQRSITPFVGVDLTRLSGDRDLSFLSFKHQLSLSQQQIKAKKNIFTHNGQYLQVQYSESLDALKARQVRVRSALAFRGVGINHNLILEGDYKSDIKEAEYQFSNGLNFRGIGTVSGRQVVRISADYHLPLLYPDIGFAGLVYLYRVRANAFYEYGKFINASMSGSRQAVGLELVCDLNLINEVPLSVGLRYTIPLDTGDPIAQFFIPVYRF